MDYPLLWLPDQVQTDFFLLPGAASGDRYVWDLDDYQDVCKKRLTLASGIVLLFRLRLNIGQHMLEASIPKDTAITKVLGS